jgi:hypothetical protein
MPINPLLSVPVPPDGRLTSQTLFEGTLDGDELMWIVAPGNAASGNTLKIMLSQMASYFAANTYPTYEVTEGATEASPYEVPADAGRVLFNIDTGVVGQNVPHFAQAQLASDTAYSNAVLFKDLFGTADTYPITVLFTDLCDGLAQVQITTAFGWFYAAPKPDGDGWYML